MSVNKDITAYSLYSVQAKQRIKVNPLEDVYPPLPDKKYQVEFSLGWGQTGIIGRVSLKLNNFSMRNLFGKNKMHRGIMPIGDGEQLALSAQTNGTD